MQGDPFYRPSLALAAAVVLAAVPRTACGSQSAPRLDSFYVVAENVSDAGPFWFDYVLEVKPDGDGTLVRLIRIAPLDLLCPRTVTVKAAGARLDRVSPSALTGTIDPCSLGIREFGRALEDARLSKLIALEDTGRWGIVARCGSAERAFHLPYPEEIDLDNLKRDSPRVWALWNLYHEVVVKAFGDKSVFYDISDERDTELQRQGAALVPELRSGRFDRGFSDCCEESSSSGKPGQVALRSARSDRRDRHPSADIMEGYRGPGVIFRQPVPSLVNAKELHLLEYAPAEYPPLAKMARIQGQVALSLTVDSRTGNVKESTALWGHPLLAKSALAAASQWQFDPNARSGEKPVVAVLSYSWTCP